LKLDQEEKKDVEDAKKETNKALESLKSGSVVFWISKLLNLNFQILSSTEVVTRLSHDQVVLFKTFRGTTQSCAR
jgi:hypothetical protein